MNKISFSSPERPPRPDGRRDGLGEAFRFVVVGGVATLFHYGLYYVLLRLGGEENLSYTVGYLVSFLLNFYLTARFTFRSRPSKGKFVGMAGAHVVNYLLHIGLLNLYLRLGVDAALAPIPVYAVAIPVNFLLVRFVFKRHRS